MKTAADTRRENLESLIEKFGSIADLNEALGRSRRDATIGIIRNQAKDSKTGTPKQMGNRLARDIEEKLSLGPGWLDAIHTTHQASPHSNVAPAPIGSRRVPLISYVQAGAMTEVADPFQIGGAFEWLLTDLDLSEHAFALEIKGDSMLPRFQPGDRVLIDPAVEPYPGDFVVAKNGEEEATFKKYRPRGVNERGQPVFELVPLNEDFEPIHSAITPVKIIGTMMEHRQYRKR